VTVCEPSMITVAEDKAPTWTNKKVAAKDSGKNEGVQSREIGTNMVKKFVSGDGHASKQENARGISSCRSETA